MLQFLLQLHYAVLPSLQLKCLLSDLVLHLHYLCQCLVEYSLPLGFLSLPLCSDLFYSLDLSLFQPGFKFGLLCPLPQLQLPDCLIFRVLIVRIAILLVLGGKRFLLIVLMLLMNNTEVLQVDNAPDQALNCSLRVSDGEVLITDPDSGIRGLFKWRVHQLS